MMAEERTNAVAGFGGSSVRRCSCAHEFQDREHGPGLRVKNLCPLQGGKRGWRCTVCGNVEEAG